MMITNKELQAARKLFFITTQEAAEHIGGVSTRSWQYWESGRSPIPDDVVLFMRKLAERRLAMIENVETLMLGQQDDEVMIDYYPSFAEYKADHADATVLDWRLSQCVAAYFFAESLAWLR